MQNTRMQNTLVCVFLTVLSFVVRVRGADPICADACLTLATNYVYGGCSETDELYYACRCISPEFLGTLALCVQEHCDSQEWEWLDMGICQAYGESGPIQKYETVITNATKYAGDPPENATLALTYPLKFPSDVFGASFDTSADFIGNMTNSSFFGYSPSGSLLMADGYCACLRGFYVSSEPFRIIFSDSFYIVIPPTSKAHLKQVIPPDSRHSGKNTSSSPPCLINLTSTALSTSPSLSVHTPS
jgi:hypothetical protein